MFSGSVGVEGKANEGNLSIFSLVPKSLALRHDPKLICVSCGWLSRIPSFLIALWAFFSTTDANAVDS